MNLLAVDTSGATGSLALVRIADGRSQLFETSWIKKAMHSEVATVQLAELLTRAGLSLGQLNQLAVNIGPGSFTGLRVGISLVKTLAYALNLPVAPFNTLEILAHANGPDRVFVATKAVRNFYYCAGYANGKAWLEPRSADEAELAGLSAGAPMLMEGQTAGFRAETSAKVLLDMLTMSDAARQFLTWKSLAPLYIRGSEAEEKLKKNGLLL